MFLTWEVDPSIGLQFWDRKLVVRLGPSPILASDSQMWPLRKKLLETWVAVVEWLTEALRGRPIPLEELFLRKRVTGSYQWHGSAMKQLEEATRLSFSRTDLTWAGCRAFAIERNTAITEVLIILDSADTVEETERLLTEWVAEVVEGSKLDSAQRKTIARVEWFKLIDATERHVVWRWASQA